MKKIILGMMILLSITNANYKETEKCKAIEYVILAKNQYNQNVPLSSGIKIGEYILKLENENNKLKKENKWRKNSNKYLRNKIKEYEAIKEVN